jgi:uncharacterized membrane protein YphA (DoxX/SURF4 family)
MFNNTSKVVTVTRVVLGLVFFIFGLNGFLQFIPQPPNAGNAAIFFGGLLASGYLLPLLKAVEVVAGAALLANRFVPLTLTVLAPIVVNIVAFHVFLAPAGLPVAAAVLVAELILAWAHRASFAPMLRSRTHNASEAATSHAAPATPVAA